MSSDTTVHQDAVATTVAAPVAGDEMVMPDGSVMDMGQHPGDATVHQDAVATTVAAPVAGDEMVMPDGSVMDMGQHPTESPGTAVTEASHGGAPAAGADHQMEMGGVVNWYVIGGVLALIAALVAVVAGMKERLARAIATGKVAAQGVSGE